MYEMAKKAREAMRGKAKRLAGEKDSKVDSSNWTPSEPLDANVKTGMRPISQRQFKKQCVTHLVPSLLMRALVQTQWIGPAQSIHGC